MKVSASRIGSRRVLVAAAGLALLGVAAARGGGAAVFTYDPAILSEAAALAPAPATPRAPRPLDFKAPPAVSPAEAEAYYAAASAKSAGLPPAGASEADVTDEIAALARALRYEPALLYEFVRNAIDFVPLFGVHRSATMTLLDRAGNDFEQSALLIALLRASGYTAQYIYGRIDLGGTEIAGWLGVPNSADVVGHLLSAAQIPYTLYTSGGDTVSHVTLDHVWVRASIGGTWYVFDPSVTAGTTTGRIDLAAATGFNRSSFVSRALSGATVTADSIRNLNRANVRADLDACAASLATYLRTNRPIATVAEVLEGRFPTALRDEPLRTALPYETARLYAWTDVPLAYHATVRIEHEGLDTALYAWAAYGHRLVVCYGTAGPGISVPLLYYDGTAIDQGDSIQSSTYYPLYLTIDHPFAGNGGTYGDETDSCPLLSGGVFYVLTAWGRAGRGLIESHRRQLATAIFEGAGSTSEEVLGETLAMIGLTWAAECSQSVGLIDAVAQTRTVEHHYGGVVGQTLGVYMDIPLINKTAWHMGGDSAALQAAYRVQGGLNGALEWGVIDQLQLGSAVSTIKMLDRANADSQKVFDATVTNYLTQVRTNLVNYTADILATVDDLVTNGCRVILPQYGLTRDGDWNGMGYLVLWPSGGMANMIYGGWSYYGGSSTTMGLGDPNFVVTEQHEIVNSGDKPQSQEPVDLYSGHYLHERTDLAVGGDPALSLAFRRSYNSGACRERGVLGRGWGHNWDLRAAAASDGFAGLGRRSAIDAAAAIAGIYAAAEVQKVDSSATALMVGTLCHRWVMDQLITNVVNVSAPGMTLQFSKLADGTFEPPPGSAAALARLGAGFRLTDSDARQADYGADGFLAALRDPNGNAIAVSRSGGRVASVSHTAGRSLAFTYDASTNLSRVTDSAGRSVAFAYAAGGLLESATDAAGVTTRYAYDDGGRLESIFLPRRPAAPLVVNAYDAFDRVAVQRDDATNTYYYLIADGYRSEEIDPAFYSRAWYFDAAGRILAEVNALGDETAYAYDSAGRLVRVTQPEGNGWELAYDGRHRVSQVRRFPKPGSSEPVLAETYASDPVFGRVTNAVDALGRATSTTLDERGNVVRVDYPAVDGARPYVTYAVNARGQVTSRRDRRGRVDAFDYDPATGDRRSATVDVAGLNQTNLFETDAAGQITAYVDGRGNRWVSRYDAAGRLTNSVAPGSAATAADARYFFDADGYLEREEHATGEPTRPWAAVRYESSPGGRPLAVIDPAGGRTGYEYDPCGRLRRLVDPEGRATLFEYDGAGRAWRQTDAAGIVSEEHGYTDNGQVAWVTDARSKTTWFVYDDHDQLLHFVYPDYTGRTFFRDACGNVTGEVTRAGQTIARSYDGMNRPRALTTSDGLRAEFAYDQGDRLLLASNAAGRTVAEYTGAGLLAHVTHPSGHAVGHQYDRNGNRSRLDYPDGSWLTYSYDAMNRLEEIRDQGGALVARYGYDPLSRIVSEELGNGARTERAFDAGGALARIRYVFVTNTVTVDYAADASGRLTGYAPDHPAFYAMPTGFSDVAYSVNDRNQLLAAGGQAVSEDGNGNVTWDGVRRYTYNSLGQVVSISSATHRATYEYDALGALAARAVDGATNRFVRDGAHVLAEFTAAGAAVRRTVYGPGMDRPVRFTGAGGTYYYHADHVGSIVALSDSAGGMAETYAYDPFGQVRSAPATGNNLLFTGRVFEPEFGLYDYRARRYSPELGRFLSVDPLAFGGGDLNLYAYCFGNPAMYRDPDGQLAPLAIAGIVLIVVVTGGGYVTPYIECSEDPGGAEAANKYTYVLVGPTWKSQHPVVRESMLIHERKHANFFHTFQRVWLDEQSTELAAYKKQYAYLMKEREKAEKKGDTATVAAIDQYVQSALVDRYATDADFRKQVYPGRSLLGWMWDRYSEGAAAHPEVFVDRAW